MLDIKVRSPLGARLTCGDTQGSGVLAPSYVGAVFSSKLAKLPRYLLGLPDNHFQATPPEQTPSRKDCCRRRKLARRLCQCAKPTPLSSELVALHGGVGGWTACSYAEPWLSMQRGAGGGKVGPVYGMARRTPTSRRTRDAGWHMDGRLERVSSMESQWTTARQSHWRPRAHEQARQGLLTSSAKPNAGFICSTTCPHVRLDHCPRDVRLGPTMFGFSGSVSRLYTKKEVTSAAKFAQK